MQALATIRDLTERCQVEVSDSGVTRADRALMDASARVRSHTGQQFTRATTTDRLDIRKCRIKLPQRPVIAVASVVDINDNAILYQWAGKDILTVTPNVPDTWAWEPYRTDLTIGVVTYTHGEEQIPDIVVGVVCQIAARAYGRPPEDSGVTSESAGPFATGYGSVSGSGAVGMLQEEKDALSPWMW